MIVIAVLSLSRPTAAMLTLSILILPPAASIILKLEILLQNVYFELTVL